MTLVLLIASPCIYAKTTSCGFEENALAPKSLVWDNSSNEAKISYEAFGTLKGKVTLIRKIQNGGEIVNITFTNPPSIFKDAEWEFIIHQPFPSQFVIFGVGYKIIDGKKYLNSTRGRFDGKCESL